MCLDKLDEDNSLPKATTDKIIAESLPVKGVKIKKDVKLFIKDAATLFLMKVALSANKLLENEKKKTLKVTHIYKALESLGFSEYLSPCKKAVDNYEEYNKKKPSKQNKFKESGLTLEELHNEQIKLFNKAKNDSFKFREENNAPSDFSEDNLVIENIEKVDNE